MSEFRRPVAKTIVVLATIFGFVTLAVVASAFLVDSPASYVTSMQSMDTAQVDLANKQPPLQRRIQDRQAESGSVQSIPAVLFLAKESKKHEETTEALQAANDRGDMEAVPRIFLTRSVELSDAIDEVNSGSYSATDKAKMLVPLRQEKELMDSSYENFPR